MTTIEMKSKLNILFKDRSDQFLEGAKEALKTFNEIGDPFGGSICDLLEFIEESTKEQ